jgi:glutamate racemase
MSPTSPIVVLDSGLGGLTVVKAIRAAMPHERIVYFGDTARMPYGNKSQSAVTGFVREVLSFLRPLQPKHVVFACNTATALAMTALRGAYPELSFSGVIEPGAKAAAAAAGSKLWPVIGVIATEATVRSKAYERAVHRRRSHVRLLLQGTPALAPLIEEGRDARDPLLRLALKQYLTPLKARGVDVLVLGCTHYPVLKGLIARMMGEKVAVIDSADQCAEDVARRLSAAGLLHPAGIAPEPAPLRREKDEPPVSREMLRCFVTDDAARFESLAPRFLGARVTTPEVVLPERLRAATVRDAESLRAAG